MYQSHALLSLGTLDISVTEHLAFFFQEYYRKDLIGHKKSTRWGWTVPSMFKIIIFGQTQSCLLVSRNSD